MADNQKMPKLPYGEIFLNVYEKRSKIKEGTATHWTLLG